MKAYFLVIVVIVTFGGHFGHAEIRIPKAARKYKTKAWFQIDAVDFMSDLWT